CRMAASGMPDMMQKACRKDFSCYLNLLTEQTAAGAVIFRPECGKQHFSTGPAAEGRGSIKKLSCAYR
ncbi:hypothetical protein, partial [Desulfovibrio sp.]|uniref:hypothetical protein n=1 Tax=Desulfovibrio sp. TaxID=885 RepID=UPI00307C7C6E